MSDFLLRIYRRSPATPYALGKIGHTHNQSCGRGKKPCQTPQCGLAIELGRRQPFAKLALAQVDANRN